MDVLFLTPAAAAVGAAAVLPVLAAFVRERTHGRIRAALDLAAPRLPARLRTSLGLAAAVALLAVAAAQPAVRVQREGSVRRDAQAFFVFDISRSMLASAGAGRPTRFERARTLATRIRARLADVPAGVVSFTDRPLPHLFPVVDRDAFAAVVRRSIGIEQPPPSERRRRATDFVALGELGTQNYFAPGARRRLAILLTDGESEPYDPDGVGAGLRRAGVELLVVHVRGRGERVYDRGGRPDPGYAPDPAARIPLERLARAAGGGVYGEDADAVASAARAYLGEGPTAQAAPRTEIVPLAAYLVAAAGAALVLLLVDVRALRRPRPPRLRPARP